MAPRTASSRARRFAEQPLEVGGAEVRAGRWLERRLAHEHLAGDATTSSGSRMWAKASATVADGPRMIISGVISPPAVPTS